MSSRRYTSPTLEIVSMILDRSQRCCEACGVGLGPERGVDWSVQHRVPRGMGGTRWEGSNLPSNLMVLCGSGTTGCHGFAESHRAHAIGCGWLVSSHADPAQHPVLIERGSRWVYFADDASYSENPPVVAA